MSYPLAYLLEDEAVQMLTDAGLSPSLIPPTNILIKILERIEVKIDNWMRYRIAPTTYVEQQDTNTEGQFLVYNYPILAVKEVQHLLPALVALIPGPVRYDSATMWRGGRTIGLFAFGRFEVTYVAGLSPIPPAIKECVLKILYMALTKHDYLLMFLAESIRDMTSLGLPGGLSQSFKRTNYKKDVFTELDRILGDVSIYRRKIIS